MDACVGYVFGYGSLAAAATGGGFPAELPGFARGWGVAMDNSVSLPGYKRYLDASGQAPRVFVCFLDVTPSAAPGATVNGLCRPVGAADLRGLDARERNYERIDVSGQVVSAGVGAAPVWTYVGTAAGRARLARGRAQGTAVIHDSYLAAVRNGFRALGAEAWARCAPSLDPGDLAVVALRREELPTTR